MIENKSSARDKELNELFKSRKEKPEKPYSGKFNLRISPELHAKLVAHAESEKTSLNTYITETLKKAVKVVSL